MMHNHLYGGHPQFNPQDSAWLHQQQQQQQSSHHHAQHAAAVAAASAAQQQQQHFNRLAAGNHAAAGTLTTANSLSAQDGSLESVITEDNRRTMNFIADLLNESTREAALLELSKKREQVPELALILWHSFGKDLQTAMRR